MMGSLYLKNRQPFSNFLMNAAPNLGPHIAIKNMCHLRIQLSKI